MGLAICDALGATLEFSPPGTFEPAVKSKPSTISNRNCNVRWLKSPESTSPSTRYIRFLNDATLG
jgi:hypothetical protein